MINLCGCFLKCCFTLLVLRIHNSFCAFTSAPALLNVPTIYIHHNNYNRRWDIVNTRYTDTGRSFRIHQHNTVVEKNTLSRKSPLWPSLRQTRLHPVTILSSCHWREESKERTNTNTVTASCCCWLLLLDTSPHTKHIYVWCVPVYSQYDRIIGQKYCMHVEMEYCTLLLCATSMKEVVSSVEAVEVWM